MKFKVFHKVKYEKLEIEVNDWLHSHPKIKIISVVQVASGAFGIIYEE